MQIKIILLTCHFIQNIVFINKVASGFSLSVVYGMRGGVRDCLIDILLYLARSLEINYCIFGEIFCEFLRSLINMKRN